MPRFVSKDGKHTIETAVPREAAELRAQGYREEVFDPTEKSVDEVLAHLDGHVGQQREIDRVLAAEQKGKARKTVLGWKAPEADGDAPTGEQPAAGDNPPA